MDPKMVVKLFKLTGVEFIMTGVCILLLVSTDSAQWKEIQKLRARDMALEEQLTALKAENDIRKKAEEAKENEEVDAE